MTMTLPFGVTLYSMAVSLSALCALLLLVLLRRREAERVGGKGTKWLMGCVDHVKLAVWCIPAALVGARLLYCLVRFNFFFFELGVLSVLNTRMGGFLLYGAVMGAMAAAALLAKCEHVSIAATLDELAAPGMLAIIICRLAEGTTTEGVGTWLYDEAFCRFPIAVQNEYGEWQLAVFLLEALVAAVILVILLVRRYARGERIMTALLLYACCQVVCESLRMDGCLRIGFVRISQVISAVVILAVTLVRALRYADKKEAVKRGAIMLLCTAAVGGLEWALDKTEVDNRILYAVMTAVSIVLIVNGTRFKKTTEV